MTIPQGLLDMVLNEARADVFKVMGNEETAEKALCEMKALSDKDLDGMGLISGIPEHQLPVYRAMIRGEPNDYFTKMKEFDGVLQSGDIILVTGKKLKSKLLVAAQLPFYLKARASHVAMVHADFICVDANPGAGVKHRTIAEVLADVEDNWRIIRFNAVNDDNRETMLSRCAYYIDQPYSIRPKKGSGAKFSYCSELVSKVLQSSNVRCLKIPKGVLVNPCHFDQLADKGKECQDITQTVRPFVPFLHEYKEMIAMQSHALIAGLMLNRYRDKQRKDLLANVQAQARAGKLPHETLVKVAQQIKAMEDKMNYRFWDSTPR